HKVDIPVPPSGFGMRLAEMHNWCHDYVEAGMWEERAHSDERRDEHGIQINFARFYFRNEIDAERFRLEYEQPIMSDLQIEHRARIIIRDYGKQSVRSATAHLNWLVSQGETERAAHWKRFVQAIERLQPKAPE